jgi:serine/threonine-protein kinase
VETLLGAGGMGEVYRATDTKLGRKVALKILPAGFAQDPERQARFKREAKVLALLNHPHIAQIYGIEDRAFVMEFVEGETLKGPLPLETALEYARQIAGALEAAHEKGIVHRDLKPRNIMITPAGVVKVLDFGLAKVAQEPISSSHSPTVTISPTKSGVILGTAAYMSPEQACGKPVDRRADIWAFGCVLFEILSGKPAFTGEATADILAAVVKTEPDFARVPAKVRRLLRRCLEKDPKTRLRDIGDAWDLLESTGEPTAPLRPWIGMGAAIVLAVALAAVAALGWWRATRPVAHPLTRLSVDLGQEAMMGLNNTVAISPDGRRLVFPARGADGRQQLSTRLLDQTEAVLLPGTEGGFDPFFSPDGQWIGFFAGGQLKKISVQGGAPVALCPAVNPRGASWGEDGNIVAALSQLTPLSLVPAAGGLPKPLTRLAPGETTHRWPQVLPDANAVLFTASPISVGQEDANIEVASLKTGQVTVLEHGGYYGRYVPSGHLVYIHQGVLFGVRFDPVRQQVLGAPMPLVDDLAANPATGGQFEVSGAASWPGTLVYLSGKGSPQTWHVSWLDSSGKTQPLISRPGSYTVPRFSPDGRELAFLDGSDIYTYDLERGMATRLTFTGDVNVPIWAPDGKHVVFMAGASSLFWIRSDGAGEPQSLLNSHHVVVPGSFSPDSRRLVYYEQDPTETGSHLWTLPLDIRDPDHPKPGKPELFSSTPADEGRPRFSPDGHWIAYQSNESGSYEIYVRPFPAGNGGKWQISRGGGLYAGWSPNGHELFYERTDYRIAVVEYSVNGNSFAAEVPRLWSEKQLFFTGASNLDLATDGKRFAVLQAPEAPPSARGSVHVMMLQNFFEELNRQIPEGGK